MNAEVNRPGNRAVDVTTVTPMPVAEDVVTPRDRVRWGPVWAGLVTAISIFLILEMLFYGFGWLTIDLNPGAGTTVNQSAGWITAILALISFFLGGWIAQLTSSVRGAWVGTVNGFMVWALGMVLILAASALGLGVAFGSLGGVLARMAFMGQSAANLPNVNPTQVAGVAQNTALWAVLFMVLSAIAAIIGGWVGDQTRIGYVAPPETFTRGTTTTTRHVTP